ncbi:uncharacterized protein KIAA1143 homolog [Paramacrobiotus metropolitanus]|uniref:uncharacterized protein KIAA1143 homolog n=1 Tax=Paramacrobiotus metropolitanus TaxID=2943436 RepID=UPI0024464892|nr:uncharacterized protein KIAA1143 homolog [Paramacrobiotus metropolitanus]XP_055338401.1 uncharacterized protein KIAA1143 homolog [Paramacrobiotus metropolitanus]
MSGRNQVTVIKPEEPAFLKSFKKRAGYKEGPTIEDKKQHLLAEADNIDDRPDEKPTIVTLRPGDLTEEEVEAIEKQEADTNNSQPETEPDFVDLQSHASVKGSEFATETETEISEEKRAAQPKVVFRKPHKRPTIDTGNPSATIGSAPAKKSKSASSMEQIQNKSLLSFVEDEECSD